MTQNFAPYTFYLCTYQWFAPGWGGATPRKLTFKLAPWEGILTIKYLLICTNYKGLCENLTSGEHSREGNLRFSSQKSQIPWGCPPPHTHTLGQTIDRCITTIQKARTFIILSIYYMYIYRQTNTCYLWTNN